MKNLAIARRYAKALFLIGKEDGQTETYRSELNNFVNLFENEKAFGSTVSNPLYNTLDRKRVLQIVTDKMELSKVIKHFLFLIFEKGRIGFLAHINEFYQRFADELKGIGRATLISATELSSEVIEKIRTGLSKKTGKDIVLEIELNPDLIGGIVTRIGDLVLDGSIKTQLFNMRESLRRGESV